MEEKTSSINKSDEVKYGISDQLMMLSGVQSHWWWAIASTAQLGWGIRVYKKGYNGDSRFMPLKAFAVASLFVGATASAAFAALRASGIHKVEDLKEVGANMRTGMGVPPRNKAK